MKFHQFHAGQVITAGPVLVTEAEVLAYARAFDPQPFHVDPVAAARGPFGGLIASGWHTAALAMRLAVQAALQDSDASASPGLSYLKWPHPVRPGDELTLHAQVLETRTSRSRPELGLMRWRWTMVNQHGRTVLELEATTTFDLGPVAAAGAVPAPESGA